MKKFPQFKIETHKSFDDTRNHIKLSNIYSKVPQYLQICHLLKYKFNLINVFKITQNTVAPFLPINLST